MKITSPECKFVVISNVSLKVMMFKGIGCTMEGHKHVFDHPTFLTRGQFEVYRGNEVHEVDADIEPTAILIEKGVVHKIVCTSEVGVGTCIHALRNGERVEDIVDPNDIPHFNAPQEGLTPIVMKDFDDVSSAS